MAGGEYFSQLLALDLTFLILKVSCQWDQSPLATTDKASRTVVVAVIGPNGYQKQMVMSHQKRSQPKAIKKFCV